MLLFFNSRSLSDVMILKTGQSPKELLSRHNFCLGNAHLTAPSAPQGRGLLGARTGRGRGHCPLTLPCPFSLSPPGSGLTLVPGSEKKIRNRLVISHCHTSRAGESGLSLAFPDHHARRAFTSLPVSEALSWPPLALKNIILALMLVLISQGP